MNSSALLSRQGHRMLQIGVALFVFSAVEGFAIIVVLAAVRIFRLRDNKTIH